ncbi:Z-ring formation inhibitor MciZ [Brevibacillus borstelensis]|nr:Z-ring formation inhibitor MciZ [Brevibacillus borstelensis]
MLCILHRFITLCVWLVLNRNVSPYALSKTLVQSILYRRRERMKTYVDEKQIRMVGKAWEIRATLRSWSKKDLTLQEYLARRSNSSRR